MSPPRQDEMAVASAPLSTSHATVAWHTLDWQKLWLGTQSREWRSLAILPGGAGGPPDLTIRVAHTLARTGMTHLGVPIRVVDGTNVMLGQMIEFSARMERSMQFGDMVLLALAPTANNPVAVALAQSAHAAMLCVVLKAMKTSEADQTVETVGRSRFLGSVVVSCEMPPTEKAAKKSGRSKKKANGAV